MVDGVNIPADLVLRDTDGTVSGEVTFSNAIANMITVDGLVDGVNLTILVDSLFYLSTDQTINGNLEFSDTVSFLGVNLGLVWCGIVNPICTTEVHTCCTVM